MFAKHPRELSFTPQQRKVSQSNTNSNKGRTKFRPRLKSLICCNEKMIDISCSFLFYPFSYPSAPDVFLSEV